MEADIISYLWIITQLIIGYNLVIPLFLFIVYLLLSHEPKPVNSTIAYQADYAIIVTAFEHTHLLSSVISSILNLRYKHFLVYVVADKCDTSNLHFDDERVIILRPEQILASNTGSHFYAINRFKRNHERLTIIDSDNLVHPEYLGELNKWFDQGFQAVQGIRKPKNLDTTLACLDAARDIYYHFYDGKILFRIGSSATLSGSGMAFTVKLYRQCLDDVKISGAGFDKVLQYKIVAKNLRIAFAEEAIVYDEKTSQPHQLVKQRSRWINTWFRFSGLGFQLIRKSLLDRRINQFLFGVILLRPPLFVFLFLSVICLLVNIWMNTFVVFLWFASILCFVFSFMLALINSDTDKKIYRSLTQIPKFVFFQVISLFRIRSSNKLSVATQHFHNSDPDQVSGIKNTD
ncbi:MAG: glycosyltransferase [Daejeonella sp.]